MIRLIGPEFPGVGMPYIATLSVAIFVGILMGPGVQAHASHAPQNSWSIIHAQDVHYQAKRCPRGKVWNSKRKRCEYFPHPKGPK